MLGVNRRRCGKMARKSFVAWMEDVDAAVVASVGMSAADLDDYAYYDNFEDGASAKATARRAVRAAGGDF